jgi:hypothetical protein
MSNCKKCGYTLNVFGGCLKCGTKEVSPQIEIAQLRTELDKHRWIPVSERLPDRKGLYLVLWHSTNDGVTQIRTCDEYIFDKNDSWEFTHWKPIILPKGE